MEKKFKNNLNDKHLPFIYNNKGNELDEKNGSASVEAWHSHYRIINDNEKKSSLFISKVNILKTNYQKNKINIAKSIGLDKLSKNNQLSLVMIALKQAKKFYNTYFPQKFEYKSFHKQKMKLISTPEKQEKVKKMLKKENLSYGAGWWTKTNTTQLFANLIEVTENFDEEARNYENVTTYFTKQIDSKKIKNVEGKISELWPDLMKNLNEEYTNRNYDKIYKLNNIVKLTNEKKKKIEKEFFIINKKSLIYEKSIKWFENIKINKEKISNFLQEKLKTEEFKKYFKHYIYIKTEIIIEEERIVKLINEFLKYLTKEEYTKN